MTDEQKKLIAEWLGWEIDFFYSRKEKCFEYGEHSFWNPHTNDTQFLEVLKHMTRGERELVEEMFFCPLGGNINDTIWVMEHKQEVLDALEEVIKNG